ncbi:hypothetical protein [Pedobacter arcticus]|uniref:hypothetical protein n=1 Tax=Pedobacter arcticus TaxID=752140 RepID=UPI00058FDE2A|nr:hypothetical protein [Pedobacter arcticus]
MTQLKKYKSFLLTVLLMVTASLTTFACEVCNKNQPKILRNITHGSGPQSNWDYFVVIAMVLIAVYTLYATIRCFLSRKTESKYNDIKNTILTPQ